MIGFGARKLFDDDDGPKYLNTPETPLYKKSHVLYGIDQAKREIAKQGRAVIVEGYTDVMACHLAGVPTAVATCGTAFGADHIGVLRRLLMDTDSFAGEIIFTFDGDAAGQKAALRAFEEDQRFVGADVHRGQPGQHGPVRAAPGQGRRWRYATWSRGGSRWSTSRCGTRCPASTWTRPRAGSAAHAERPRRWSPRSRTGRCARSTPASSPATSAWTSSRCSGRSAAAASRRREAPAAAAARRQPADSPQRLVEREALKLALQVPVLAGPMFDALGPEIVRRPGATRRSGRRSRRPAARPAAAGGAVWIEAVRDACADLAAKALVGELAVEPLRVDGEADPRYVAGHRWPGCRSCAVNRPDPRTSSRRCSGSTRWRTRTSTSPWPASSSRSNSTRARCASRRRVGW